MTDPLAHVLRRGILAELKSGPLEVAELARRLDAKTVLGALVTLIVGGLVPVLIAHAA
jgi:hypothetical protein